MKKYCLSCLCENKIIEVENCDNKEHRTRFENKKGYNKKLNDLIDKKLAEAVSLLEVFVEIIN